MAGESVSRARADYGGASFLNRVITENWLARLLGAGVEAAKLPGDVYAGRVDPNSQEAVERSADLAGFLGLGGTAKAALAPRGENALGIFGGRLAKTADLDALAKAEKLEAAGAHPADVWEQTGWGRGADGEWRFEIDDSKAKSPPFSWGTNKDLENTNSVGTAMSEAIDHPELLAAYPDLADVGVRLDRHQGGSYRSGTADDPSELIRTGTTKKGIENFEVDRSTMLHELQHAVQEREGFARGGNPAEEGLKTIGRDLKQKAASEHAEISNEMRDWQLDQYAERGFVDNDPNYTRIMRQLAAEWRLKFPKRSAELDRAFSDMESAPGSTAYMRLAGEVEARNVSKRMDMTPEMRRAHRPELTEHMPRDRQVVRFATEGTTIGKDTRQQFANWKKTKAEGAPEASIEDEPLFHGSPRTDLEEIKPSDRGPLGPGVYTTPTEDLAKHYAGESGKLYRLPDRPRDIYRGRGHRTDEQWFGFKEDRERLIAAADPIRRDEVRAILEKTWSGDGYPAFVRLSQLYGGDRQAQELFKRAGFEGISGLVDGHEVLLFDQQSLRAGGLGGAPAIGRDVDDRRQPGAQGDMAGATIRERFAAFKRAQGRRQ